MVTRSDQLQSDCVGPALPVASQFVKVNVPEDFLYTLKGRQSHPQFKGDIKLSIEII